MEFVFEVNFFGNNISFVKIYNIEPCRFPLSSAESLLILLSEVMLSAVSNI